MENILVLGSRVQDGLPAPVLESRLQRALLLFDARQRTRRPARIVVSGFREADAMARWLIARGVPAEAIVEEPDATSTNENLENAHRLLPETTRWLVVTSGYHAPRARMWAWHLGIPVRVFGAVTPPARRSKHLVREAVVFPYSLARVLWRRWRARSAQV